MNVPFRFDPHLLLARLPQLTTPSGFDLRAISALVARLSPRERRFVCAAGVVLGGMLIYLLVLDPLWEAHSRLRVRVAAKERELGEMIALRRTYQTLRQQTERTRLTGNTNFSPFAFLEGLATSTVGRDKVAAINPAGRETRSGVSQETIELRLNGVSLRELVELLYKIDTAGAALRTIQVSIKKRYKDPYSFDVSLTSRALSAR
jgi:type II secretory pathway component PulM